MKILQMRLAPLPILLGLVLLVPVVVQGQPAPTSRTQIVVQGQPAPTTQNSRAATIAAEQAEKAKTLHPYTPNAVERRIVWLKREFLELPSGFYPYFASVYSGGGFTLGAGYRQFYGDRTHADVKGLYSISNYKLLEVSTDSWGHAGGRLDLHARGGWRDATQVAFHGLGMDSPEDQSNYRMKQAYFGGDVRARPGGYTVFGAGMTYEDFTLEQGQGSGSVDRRDSHAGNSAGTGREPDLPARGRLGRHRLASVARLCPSRRALRSLVS